MEGRVVKSINGLFADEDGNIDFTGGGPWPLADVLQESNVTDGNNIILSTGDFIGNPDFPFALGYQVYGDKNLMTMIGADADKATGFLLQEHFGELASQMLFSDLNTGNDHSFRANINGLEMESENSDYSTQVNINPYVHVSQMHNLNNGANTDVSQYPDSILNYVNDLENNRSIGMQLSQSQGVLTSERSTGVEQYLAEVTVNPKKGVVLHGYRDDGVNLDSTQLTVRPELFRAAKDNHMLLVDPDFNSVGTGFYTADDSELIVSQFSIEPNWINLNSTDVILNKTASLHVSHQEPLVNLTARMDTIQSTLDIEPSNIRLVKTSEFDPNLVGYTEVRSDEIETTLINQTSPDIADHFIVKTWHSVGGVFTTANYTGLNNYSESFVFKDFIRLYNATDDDSIYVSIENGAATFITDVSGYGGQTTIDPLGVVTSGSFISNDFEQGLGNSSSGFAVLWYDTPVAHTEPVMTIGSWNPETSTGIGMQISEYGLWSNLETSYAAHQYFLEDVYLQNGRIFTDNADAAINGLPLNAMYATPTGEVRLRV